ncbi:MAG: T9SS type A sorting domain-containing protein, partial [Bacteroidota bacterium]
AADSSGNFILEVETAAAGIELAVSAVGYGSETIEIKRREAVAARAAAGIPAIVISTIVLTAVPALEEVMITANPPALHPVIAGGISVCRKVTQYEKVKSRVKEVLGTNEIKVYPNPIVKNGSFRIVFHVNNPGQYALQVTGVTGKIIYGRQITIFSKDQTEYFDASLFAGTGIYFVYITGKYNGKTYSNKLLLQY